jgi:molybdopterin converting factor small subunit
MRVRVRFFASVRERLRRAEADIELRDGAVVAELWNECAHLPAARGVGVRRNFARQPGVRRQRTPVGR